MNVANSKFIAISHFDDTHITKVEWLATSTEMTPDEFKSETDFEVQAFQKYQSTKIFVEFRYFGYALTPEEEAWHFGALQATFEKVGLKKIAVMVSPEIYAFVTTNQNPETTPKRFYEMSYFDDETKAYDWLKS
ncbi:MAG: hypothetical protein EAZ95_10620 [Bacteroidetes bacterium]|nr:MAG: hypothetical protein EAZ95_10620 [Bacteroidota bacterium]